MRQDPHIKDNPASGEIDKKEEAMWWRLLVDQSRDGIVVIDQDGCVFAVNQKFAGMGLSAAPGTNHCHDQVG
ncbi:MAG: PAS domain S-box protein [Desulfosarcinaceae bacterium]